MHKAEILRLKLVQHNIQHQISKSIQVGQEALKLLGIRIPLHPSKFSLIKIILILKIKLFHLKIDDLKRMPLMTNYQKQLSIKILNDIGAAAYLEGNEQLFAYVILYASHIGITYGNCPELTVVFIAYGLILKMILNDSKTSHSLANLSLHFNDHFNHIKYKSQLTFMYAVFFHWWTQPIEDITKKFIESIEAGRQSGDFFYMTYSCCNISMFNPKLTISDSIKYASTYIDLVDLSKFKDAHKLCQLFYQFWLALSGQTYQNTSLSNESFDENAFLPKIIDKTIKYTYVPSYYLIKLELYFHFDDFLAASDMASQLLQYQSLIVGQPHLIEFFFYHYLCLAQQISPSTKRTCYQSKMLNKYLTQFKKFYSLYPDNFQHLLDIMLAENYRIRNQKNLAIEHYERAISFAQNRQFLRYEALANELCAKFFIQNKQFKIAKVYLFDAHYCYQRWGAQAKADHIKEMHPWIFESYSSTPHHTINKHAKTATQLSTTLPKSTNSIELHSVLKATLAVSKEIHIQSLIQTILSAIIEIAGAERGLFIQKSNQDQRFYIQGHQDIKTNESEYLSNNPLDSYKNISHMVTQLVLQKKDIIVIDNGIKDPRFNRDTYIMSENIKSILAAPIIYQGIIKGIIYLENNLIVGAFTTDRIEFIQVLSAQIAIALENATIYENLESIVKQRTVELKNTNESLEKARAEAEQSNRYKSTFLAQMSHDLRTPLHVINGILDVLIKSKEIYSNKQLHSSIQVALQSGERQLSLINDILDLSKIEAGKIDVLEEPFVFDELFEGLDEQMGTLLGGKSVKFVLERTPPSPPFLRGGIAPVEQTLAIVSDKKRLQQVITNLLSNSAKFTVEGSISLSVGHTPPSPALRNRQQADVRGGIAPVKQDVPPPYEGGDQEGVSPTQRLFFSVSDSGIGMTPENAKCVFESYTMIENELQKKVQGTGLGLSICKGFVEALGGEIWCESEKGKGTSFIFWIPFTPVENPDLGALGGQVLAGDTAIDLTLLKTKNILMIDDDEFNRAFAQMILDGKTQYKMAASGQEALALVKSEKFDLIFTDMEMPEMDGKDTFKAIRKANSSTPIVVLTAKVMKGVREELLEFGFDGYLAKPFKEDDLLTFIHQQLISK